MTNRYGGLLVVVAFLVLLLTAAHQSYEAYRWKQVADARGWRADLAYTYLAEPVGKGPDGTPISRAQLLDALLTRLTNGHPQNPPR